MFPYLVALIIFCLIIAALCICLYFFADKTIKTNQEFIAKLKEKGFEVSKSIEQGVCVLAVDEKNSKWCVKINNERATKIYDYRDIIEFELYQDGESIAKNNTIGTLVGGALFGIAGVVGARKKINGVCTMLQLRIRVNNLNNPEITLNFIKSAIKKDSALYKNIFEKSKEMAATLTYIQNKADTLQVL